MKRKALVSAIALLAIINIVLFIFSHSLTAHIILSLLSFMQFIIIWLSGRELTLVRNLNEDLQKQKQHLMEENNQIQEERSRITDNEEKLKTIIEKMNSLVFILDQEGNMTYLSNEIVSFFNLKHESIFKGIDILEDHIHPDDKIDFIKDKHRWGLDKSLQKKYRMMVDEHTIRWIELQIHSTHDSQGNLENIYGSIIDITNQQRKEEKLSDMAFYDVLTSLPNRIMLKTQLRKAISRARRKDHDVTVMFMDLDGFKSVNDKLGHDVGDELLREVAIRLSNSVREEDLVSRIGGDEFIIMFEETEKDEVLGIAERILREMSVPFPILQNETSVTPSIGIAMFPEDGENIDSLVENADKAMYYAKSNGKNTFQFYTPELENYKPSESVINKVLSFFQK